MDLQIKEKTISLIDSLKSTCQTYGMGNDGNEYKIITQVFLYKYLNDKFGYEIKKLDERKSPFHHSTSSGHVEISSSVSHWRSGPALRTPTMNVLPPFRSGLPSPDFFQSPFPASWL